MLELAGLRRLQFYARKFTVETVEHPDPECDGDCPAEMTRREKDRCSPRDDVTENRQLIGRDGGLAEFADDKIFDGSVDEREDIECSLLGGIENHIFDKFVVHRARRREPVSAQIAMQLSGIPKVRRHVEREETFVLQSCAESLLERSTAT